jgi:hypothetical protein
MKSSLFGKLISLVFSSAAFCVPVKAALVPPGFIDSVVALGALVPQQGGPPGRLEWQATGTGFFYAFLTKDDPDGAQKQYEVYLVTAKHVVQPFISANLNINVRLNPKAPGVPAASFRLPISRSRAEALGSVILIPPSMWGQFRSTSSS